MTLDLESTRCSCGHLYSEHAHLKYSDSSQCAVCSCDTFISESDWAEIEKEEAQLIADEQDWNDLITQEINSDLL